MHQQLIEKENYCITISKNGFSHEQIRLKFFLHQYANVGPYVPKVEPRSMFQRLELINKSNFGYNELDKKSNRLKA